MSPHNPPNNLADHPTDQNGPCPSIAMEEEIVSLAVGPIGRDQGHGFSSDDHRPPVRQRARTRGVTACSLCRSRKTKCDNRRPTCGYCSRIQAECVYEDDLEVNSCHIIESKLLEKIDNLTGLLQSQGLQFSRRDEGTFPPILPDTEFSAQPAQNHIENHYHHHYYYQEISKGTEPKEDHKQPQGSCKDRGSLSVGVDSVLSWKIFPQTDYSLTLLCDSDGNRVQTHPLPNVEYIELARLESKYIAYVHTKNPIVDPQVIHYQICHVVENGLSWDTSTCLVALVCALGAISERYVAKQQSSPGFSPDGMLVDHEPMKDLEIADRFWNIAVKRIGLAMSENSLEAVQCLCLSGIWYMYNFQPLQAWKYFRLASNAWYVSFITGVPSPTDTSYNAGDSLTLEQSLYFTCYKSECELAFELPLPTSFLHDISYPHAFPSPPNLDNQMVDTDESAIQRRSWYYYLAEIASRHLLNRIIQSHTSSKPQTPKDISRMLQKVQIFQSQLENWYISLPPSLSFPRPIGDITPLEEELPQLLRGRYLAILELCFRPFVQLCVSDPLEIEPDLLAKVADAASEGLKYCMIRLWGLCTPNRHHGLWFVLRLVTTTSLILIAADKAKSNPTLNGAQRLQMPEGWKQQILNTRELFSRFWSDRKGGIHQCSQILDWALADGEMSQ